jgi:hypothetical protein
MNSCQSGGAGDKSNDLKIFPLRNEDLVFSKNSDGILSCGYKVSNALLNATLSMPMIGGDKHAKKDNTKHKAKTNENEIKSAKIMEDLVIPSSLYYGKPVSGNKVFNYKKGKKDKDKKGRDSSSDNESDGDVIEESLYDKLLSLVSFDNKVKYDKKTRKHTDGHAKINTKKDGKIVNIANIEDDNKNKTKNKNKKTKKVRFAV